jgi:hypothetical protein
MIRSGVEYLTISLNNLNITAVLASIGLNDPEDVTKSRWE